MHEGVGVDHLDGRGQIVAAVLDFSAAGRVRRDAQDGPDPLAVGEQPMPQHRAEGRTGARGQSGEGPFQGRPDSPPLLGKE